MNTVLPYLKNKMAAITGRLILYCYQAHWQTAKNKKAFIPNELAEPKRREILLVNNRTKINHFSFKTYLS